MCSGGRPLPPPSASSARPPDDRSSKRGAPLNASPPGCVICVRNFGYARVPRILEIEIPSGLAPAKRSGHTSRLRSGHHTPRSETYRSDGAHPPAGRREANDGHEHVAMDAISYASGDTRPAIRPRAAARPLRPTRTVSPVPPPAAPPTAGAVGFPSFEACRRTRVRHMHAARVRRRRSPVGPGRDSRYIDAASTLRRRTHQTLPAWQRLTRQLSLLSLPLA